MLMAAVTEVTVVARGPSQNRSFVGIVVRCAECLAVISLELEQARAEGDNQGVKSESPASPSAVPTRNTVDPRVARQTVKSVQKYLRTFKPPIGGVPDDRQPVVHVLWGWWMYLVEQAMIVVSEAERGHGAATTPLVRSIGEHADLMLWLADAGPDGITALHAANQDAQQKLWDSYERSTGHPPEGVPRPPDPDPMRTTRGEHALSGLRSVEQRMESVEGGVPYYIYRLLSGLTHAGLSTSRVYAPVTDEFGPRWLNTPDKMLSDSIADASVLDVASRCVHGSLIFQREVQDPGLETKVTRWCNDMHISSELPTFATPKDSQATTQDVAISARRILNMGLEPVSRVLETLAADELPTDVDPATVRKTLGRLEGSARKLIALYSEAK
jgi:hypothetical protein